MDVNFVSLLTFYANFVKAIYFLALQIQFEISRIKEKSR